MSIRRWSEDKTLTLWGKQRIKRQHVHRRLWRGGSLRTRIAITHNEILFLIPIVLLVFVRRVHDSRRILDVSAAIAVADQRALFILGDNEVVVEIDLGRFDFLRFRDGFGFPSRTFAGLAFWLLAAFETPRWKGLS